MQTFQASDGKILHDLMQAHSSEEMQTKLTANRKRRESQGMTLVRTSPKIGRNDPCPCGSGKKFKKCHISAKPVEI